MTCKKSKTQSEWHKYIRKLYMKQDKWISVKKRLPEEGKQVLTIDAGDPNFKRFGIDYIVKFDSETEPYIWACRLASDYDKVTHWMPLPELPEKE